MTLIAAVTLGIRVPSLGLLVPFLRAAPLDYGTAPYRGFSPLADEFIRRTLGEVIPEPGSEASERLPRSEAGPVDRAAPARVTQEHPLTNDDVEDAREAPGVPFTARTNTETASRQPGEPEGCSGGTTVWYSYRAVGDAGLVANTFGTTYASGLAVYERVASQELTPVGCDTDLNGNAIVPFSAKRGTTYLFQIAATVRGGAMVFNLEVEGVTTQVSATDSGEPANGSSLWPSVSADGRYMAFESTARNLDPSVDQRLCWESSQPDNADDIRMRAFLASLPTDGCDQVFIVDRATNSTRLVSKSSAGIPANATSDWAHVSGDGRFVAFRSQASNLVVGDTNESADIFVHDLQNGTTERVSVSSAEEQAAPDPTVFGPLSADQPSISHDGRYVAFVSTARNLVHGDTNSSPDVFVRDRTDGTTERVSVSSAGEEQGRTIPGVWTNDPLESEPWITPSRTMNAVRGLGYMAPSISADGRYVVFHSEASNLVPADSNGVVDAFVHDRLTRATERISVSSSGEQSREGGTVSGYASRHDISADGRFVVFASHAPNLVAGDTNKMADVFVRDRRLGRTIRVSVSSAGHEAEKYSEPGVISADGRWVAFASNADNLAPGARRNETGDVTDLYVHDLLTRTTERVPVAPPGNVLERSASRPFLSADGSVIAFHSFCLDACGDRVTPIDVFVHERPWVREGRS